MVAGAELLGCPQNFFLSLRKPQFLFSKPVLNGVGGEILQIPHATFALPEKGFSVPFGFQQYIMDVLSCRLRLQAAFLAYELLC
jgi:hypothetical protein